MKAGMHRQTARRYLAAKAGPKALGGAHTWRTREDPLEAIWPLAERWLTESPEVEFKALFEHLVSTHPGEVDGRALRTFQRRAADWLRRHGPPKEVFFAQKHEPGECLQSDWTNANELKVTIGGEAFAHLLCHCVLPYSNWEQKRSRGQPLNIDIADAAKNQDGGSWLENRVSSTQVLSTT